jgi:hypothetical protein
LAPAASPASITAADLIEFERGVTHDRRRRASISSTVRELGRGANQSGASLQHQ